MFPDSDIKLTFHRPNHQPSADGIPDVVNLTINRGTCTATCDNPCPIGVDGLRVVEVDHGSHYVLCTARDLQGHESPGKPVTIEYFPICDTPEVKL